MSLAAAEPLEKPDNPVGHSVLFLKQREDTFRRFHVDHSSFSVDPCALDGSAHATGSNANAWIVAYSFYFSSVRIGADEQFPIFLDEPDRGTDRVAGFAIGFDTDAFLASELGQYVTYGVHCKRFQVGVDLGNADGVTHTNQDNAVAGLGL